MDHQPHATPAAAETDEVMASPVEKEALPQEPDPPRPEETPSPASSGAGSAVAIGLIIAVTFILGLAIGFFGRPALIQDLPIEVAVTVIPNQSDEPIAQATSSSSHSEAEMSEGTTTDGNTTQAESDSEADSAMPTPTIMDFVMSDARHIQGDEAAPVTIVEFSDFN